VAPSTTAPGLVVAARQGQWLPAARTVSGQSAVSVGLFQPPGGGPLVGVAKMDTSLLRFAVYAGTSQPGGQWSNQAMVAPALRDQLVVAFNSGFQFNLAQGGWFADGRVGVPLRAGTASLVVWSDGSATVGAWGRDMTMSPRVVAVRQNLPLLVDAGAAVPSSTFPRAWGPTLGGVVRTWRSGLGDDGIGHLIYAGGPGLDPAALAAVLVAAGARRAMELDINPEWVLFDTFSAGPGPTPTTVPSKLLPNMFFRADHFFGPDWRDFVVAFAKPKTLPVPAAPPQKGPR
jgi:hypothetical protein